MINTNRSYLIEEFITIEVNLSPLKKFHRLPVPINLLPNPTVLISVIRLFPFKKFFRNAANGWQICDGRKSKHFTVNQA